MDDLKDLDNNFPKHVDVALIKCCLQKGDAKLALFSSQILLAKDPNQVEVLLYATIAARSIGWIDEAFSYAHNATVVAPDQPAAFSLLGDILLLQKKPNDALDILLHAHNLGDHTAQNYFNIGSAYMGVEAFEKATFYFNHALEMNPNMVVAHVNKGLVAHSLMNLNEAIGCFDAALQIDPDNLDAKWNKSHILLAQGKYQEGLKLYETRWKNPKIRLKKRALSSSLWLGQEDLSNRTILLFAEGGFGDTFQFIRYAKLFAKNVSLIIQCQEPLIKLVSNMGLSAQIITPGDQIPMHDFHCPLMSLPLAFGHDVTSIPCFDRYIYAENDLKKKWRSLMSQNNALKIGVMVRGSGSFQEDKRSLTLDKLLDYLPSGSNFVLLQKEINEFEKCFVESNDRWIAPCLNFSETAAVCDLLDVIISVDTSVAHLALAMGKPTIVLLPFRPDWRWGCEADKTVWYPNCLLLRQTQRDDWTDVLSLISTTIAKLTL